MDTVDLAFAGAFEQARLVRTGDVSATEVVVATLGQIEALNPRLNAYRIVYGEQAMTDARRSDERRSRDEAPSLLDGVPVAIKDDADIAGDVTAWGTDAYGAPKEADSDVVARLRAAGAIIMGKTHGPEMTLWRWTASKSGEQRAIRGTQTGRRVGPPGAVPSCEYDDTSSHSLALLAQLDEAGRCLMSVAMDVHRRRHNKPISREHVSGRRAIEPRWCERQPHGTASTQPNPAQFRHSQEQLSWADRRRSRTQPTFTYRPVAPGSG